MKVRLIPFETGNPVINASGSTSKPRVTVLWPSSANTTRYELEETDPSGYVTAMGSNTNSWSGIVFATGYVRYRVRACNGHGCSGWSAYGQVYLQSGIDL